MVFKFTLFIKELVMFAISMVLGVFVASSHAQVVFAGSIGRATFSWADILALAIFIVIFYLVMSRLKRARTVFLYIFLALTIFIGSEIVISAFWKSSLTVLVSLALLVLVMVARVVLVHNLGIILAIVGTSTLVGVGLEPVSAVVLLVIFSIYDIVAVYWTRHMVSLARGMIESGVVFGFVVPSDFSGFWATPHKARQEMGGKFMVLGSGDVALPLILISSVAATSLVEALVVCIFACLGLFLTHLLFMNQSERRAMAALPPIAMMTIVGYLIATLI